MIVVAGGCDVGGSHVQVHLVNILLLLQRTSREEMKRVANRKGNFIYPSPVNLLLFLAQKGIQQDTSSASWVVV